MSEHNEGPRAGSRAYLALKKLYLLGGQASIMGWMSALGCSMPMKTFYSEVIAKLTVRQKIYARDGIYFITDDGLEHLGVEPDAAPCERPALAGPRYVAPMRPLSSKNIPNLRMLREGAFDYRDIPSLQGSTRVEFKTSLKLSGGDVRG